MEFNEVLKGLGYFKKWHILTFGAIIAINIVMAEHLVATVFFQAIPNHRCRLSNEDSKAKFQLLKEEWEKNYPKDEHSTTNYTQCMMYENGSDSNSIKCKDNAVVFDHSVYIDSAVTYFNMVCTNKWLLSTADALSNVGFLTGSLILGWCSDRFGRKPVLCLNLILQLLSGIAIICSHIYGLYILGRFLNGFADAGVCISSYVLALEMVYPKHRLYASLIIQISNAAGVTITAVYGYLLRQYVYFYGVICAPGVIFMFFWFIIFESPRWQIASNRLQRAMKNVKRIAKWNNVDLTKAQAEGNFDILGWLNRSIETNEREETQAVNRVNILRIVKYRRLLIRTLILCFSWLSVALTYYGLTYFNNYLSGNHYMNFFVGGMVEIAAYVIVLFTLNRFGRRVLYAGFGISAGVFLIVTGFIPSNMGWLIVTVFMIGKLAVCTAFSVAYIYTVEVFPTVIRNTALGMCSMSGRIGSISAPYILLTVDYWKPAPTLIFGGLMLTSGVLCLYLPETLNKNLPETLEEGEAIKRSSKPDEG